MRRAAPVEPPVALTIAGSDSGGGAGIQADLQTMAAHDVFGTSVVTAVTAQNTRGVRDSHVLPLDQVQAQADAVFADFDVGALKTGMLATAPIVEAVADRVAGTAAPAVVDPVMVAASGDRLLAPEAEAAYEDLVAEATVVTPNADEAAVLTGVEPEDVDGQRRAGEALVETGADAALVKGGHVEADPVRDVLVTEHGATTFEHPRVDTDATHGSGCSLSAAIAAHLARGADVEGAVEAATAFLERAVRYGYDVGEGPGAVNHLVDLRDRAERQATAEAVRDAVRELVAADARGIVPEVGTTVAGATPAAETVSDVAAVDGRLTRGVDGVRWSGSVRFGASEHVARALLAAREVDADLRFALDCRLDDAVVAAVEDLGWTVQAVEATAVQDDHRPAADGASDGTARTGGTAGGRDAAVTRRALERSDGTPVAVLDRGGEGLEPVCRLLARDATALSDRALSLLDALRSPGS